MTPQLMQSIRLLQMDYLELSGALGRVTIVPAYPPCVAALL